MENNEKNMKKCIFYTNIIKPITFIGLFCATLILLCSSIVMAQNNTVSGTVTDAQTGETLPGVNILVVGASIGTATDAQGHYSVNVSSLQDSLRFSFIGYQQQLIPIKGRSTINVSMKLTTISGQQLVVVGFGTQKKKDVTASISSISGNELKNTTVSNALQALTGKIAGVRVDKVSGKPGGETTIRIRGIGSIGAGNKPLFVVDGLPTSSFNVPPEDIESINILKGASAAAIYGSRGANGVVIITTKGGTQKTQIQLNSSVGLQSVRKGGMTKVLNARQFAQFQKQRISDNIRFHEGREPTSQDIPKAYRNPQQYGEGTNWLDAILRKALETRQNFSISTGNKVITSRVSATYLNTQGALLNTGFKKYSLRANLIAHLSNKFTVGARLAPTVSNNKFANTGGNSRGGAVASALLLDPIVPVRQPDGSLTHLVTGPDVLGYASPVDRLKHIDRSRNIRRFIMHLFAQYEPFEGMTIKSALGINENESRTNIFRPSTLAKSFNIPPPTIPTASYAITENHNLINKNTLKYKTNIGENNSLNVLLGFTVQDTKANIGSFNGTDFVDNAIKTLNAAPTLTGGTNIVGWGLVSYLARIHYAFKDKYLLTATVRRDGSSRFGSNNKWGTFPSFSAGWRISGENFMKNIPQINNLLLRVAYGRSGNFNIGNYAHLGTLTPTNYALNNQLIIGRSITNLGNKNLGWEEESEFDIGLNLSMFNNRLNIDADYYNRFTYDMLLNVEVPYTSGFSSTLTNKGQVRNRGEELSIDAAVIRNPSLNWNIKFNISHNSNKVTRLASSILTPASSAHHITQEGYPIGEFYGFKILGFFKNEQEIENSASSPGDIPGSYKFEDVNKDGKITPVTDFVRIGNPYPDFFGGITNSINYKNFDFSIEMAYSHGAQILRRDREDNYNLDGVFNVSVDALHRWMSPDDPGAGLIPRAISNVIHRYGNSAWVQDASYLWIRYIALGRSFNSQGNFLSSMGISKLRIYLRVQNAWISNKNFQNPMATGNPDSPLRVGEVRNSTYPISKVFTFGINVNF
jgi:TonB-linked SusC/RagA family outer membrane protein